jgi:hypothetical protein
MSKGIREILKELIFPFLQLEVTERAGQQWIDLAHKQIINRVVEEIKNKIDEMVDIDAFTILDNYGEASEGFTEVLIEKVKKL